MNDITKYTELNNTMKITDIEKYDSEDQEKLITFNPEEGISNIETVKLIKNLRSKMLSLYLQTNTFCDNLEMEVIEYKGNKPDILSKTYLTLNAIKQISEEEFNEVYAKIEKKISRSSMNIDLDDYKCLSCVKNSRIKEEIFQYKELIDELYTKNKLLQEKLIKYKKFNDK